MLLCRILPAGYTAPLTQVSGDVFPDGGRGRAPASPGLLRPSAASGAAQPPRPQGASFRRKREPRGAWEKQRNGAVKGTAPLSVEKIGILPLFRVFTGFASRIRSRAAKPAKYENLRVFIRSYAHAVRAGFNIRGCGPLTAPEFFDSPVRIDDYSFTC